ncbi:response regulator [Spirochaetia bacterium 38H-sp]|uniref:Response regulator n=1 Tax=Rarispira pelagica TaxID=3141764 RepID=A0ABU9UDZ5_9SPIR
MQKRIAVADDLAFMRLILRQIVEKEGHIVVGEASNGLEAVSLCRKTLPDLLFLDIAMPVIDGLRALERIRTLCPSVSVIMCSGLGEQDLIVRAIQLGARDFVTKPFREERIVSAMRKALCY